MVVGGSDQQTDGRQQGSLVNSKEGGGRNSHAARNRGVAEVALPVLL